MSNNSDSLKILHTSDWHLGRSLYDRKRYDEFSKFLDWLAEFIKIFFQLLSGRNHAGHIQFYPHEIFILKDIGVLLTVQNIEPLGIEKRGNLRQKPLAVLALY